jgi:hypothetical protein
MISPASPALDRDVTENGLIGLSTLERQLLEEG